MTSGETPSACAVDAVETDYRESTDLAVVRGFVRYHALRLGLPALRADLLTLAVSELATNTLQHTVAGGRVRVWAADGRLFCDVIDQGAVRTFGRVMPAADAVRGRGLAIVERICDEIEVSTEADGTHVRLGLLL